MKSSLREWTPEEDERLREEVARRRDKPWTEVGGAIGSRGAKECKRRWQLLMEQENAQESWTGEEDEIVRQAISHGLRGRWKFCSQQLHGSRTANQCRERWYRSLRPYANGEKWNSDEYDYLCYLHHRYHGDLKLIFENFPCRSEHSIRFRLYRLIENGKIRIKKEKRKEESEEELDELSRALIQAIGKIYTVKKTLTRIRKTCCQINGLLDQENEIQQGSF